MTISMDLSCLVCSEIAIDTYRIESAAGKRRNLKELLYRFGGVQVETGRLCRSDFTQLITLAQRADQFYKQCQSALAKRHASIETKSDGPMHSLPHPEEHDMITKVVDNSLENQIAVAPSLNQQPLPVIIKSECPQNDDILLRSEAKILLVKHDSYLLPRALPVAKKPSSTKRVRKKDNPPCFLLSILPENPSSSKLIRKRIKSTGSNREIKKSPKKVKCQKPLNINEYQSDQLSKREMTETLDTLVVKSSDENATFFKCPIKREFGELDDAESSSTDLVETLQDLEKAPSTFTVKPDEQLFSKAVSQQYDEFHEVKPRRIHRRKMIWNEDGELVPFYKVLLAFQFFIICISWRQ